MPQVPPFAVAASTVRVPVTVAAALRRATADLRQNLIDGRRPAGLTGADTLAARPPGNADHPVTPEAAHGNADTPAGSPRPWAGLARGYLILVLVLRPHRPRPADSITVYIATTADPLSERPDGSTPRRRRGQDRPGPEPDATP
ncbi:hypothetical protein KEF29_21900 [Streptomyces tuirus]|uniref:Uncharacterized protein n=1 Tax=Streptomyces tuirus TaxID=68278 RepID=A0A941J6M5_9ACTN|nr:hypothetical protein [Streptomyces tuirus]